VDEIRKAFTITDSDHLVLTDDDLEQLRPSGDGPIRVEHLLRGPQMDLSLLSGRTLHLVPAHAAAESGYAAINHVLAKSDLWAIGAGCLADSRVPVALRSVEGRLQLHVLHWPRERRACPGFGTPASKISSESNRAIERLLPEWQKPFRWTDYVDEFEQRLAQLVQEKLTARSRQTNSKRRTPITGSSSSRSSAPARRAA
jgi:non-homologous end joining protein Ku